jgi:hypothetical protein
MYHNDERIYARTRSNDYGPAYHHDGSEYRTDIGATKK